MSKAPNNSVSARHPVTSPDGRFSFDCPLVAFEKADAAEGKRKRIGGIISTDDIDQQQERILQNGLDFSSFTKQGWYNDNHKNDSSTDIVGYPDSVSTYRKGQKLPNGDIAKGNVTWTEGYLVGQKGDQIWRLAKDLQGSDRHLGFSVEGEINKRLGSDRATIASADIKHVAITHCLPGDVAVSGNPKAITRRHYTGEMIDIELEDGLKLSGTPNHPILTQRGWVPLGQINESTDRVGSRLNVPSVVLPAGVDHDVNDVPPTFDEMFDAALGSGAADRRRVIEGDFHGDASGGQVDIVSIKGQLRDRLNALFKQRFGESILPASSESEAALSVNSDPMLMLRTESASLHPLAHQSGHGRSSFLRQTAGPAPHFFGKRSSDARLCDDGMDALATNAVLPRQFSGTSASDVCRDYVGVGAIAELFEAQDMPADVKDFADVAAASGELADQFCNGLSSRICFRNVLIKRSRSFCGHVYNLETLDGWYDANGIATHNCPVNSNTKLEVLARSLSAVERQAAKAFTYGSPAPPTGTNRPGPTPNVPVTGEGAGQVTSNSFADKRKKRHKQKSGPQRPLSKQQAMDWVIKQVPGASAAWARKFVKTARQLKRRGLI